MTARGLASAAIALVIASGMPAPTAVAAAPRGIVYDSGAGAGLLLNGDGRRPGLASIPGVLHQGPALPLVAPELQAGKVTAFAPTATTPSVVGRSSEEVAALIRDAIITSGSHTVFLDEITADFRSETGANVRSAMIALSHEPSPWGEESLARHVQVYIPTPGWMLNDASGWRDAWAILAASGGVWLETFRAREGRPVAWAAADWLHFPAAVGLALGRAGGDRGRLHLLVGPGPQARTWRLARTGPNCALLMNGPGAYRLGRDASAFLDQFHAAFGADGAGRPRCLPEPVLGPRVRHALAGALGLAEGGLVNPAALTARPALVSGRRVTLLAALGQDPLGLARRFGVSRAEFWRRARPRLRILGVGVARTVRLPRTGRGAVPLRLRDTGALEVELLVDGSSIRWAVGRPADLARALPPRPALKGIRPRLVASPSTWDLTVPLRIPGRLSARATFEVRASP